MPKWNFFPPEQFEWYFLDRYNPIYKRQMWKTRCKQHPRIREFYNACVKLLCWDVWYLLMTWRIQQMLLWFVFLLCDLPHFQIHLQHKEGIVMIQRIHNEHLRFIQFSFESAGRSIHASMSKRIKTHNKLTKT